VLCEAELLEFDVLLDGDALVDGDVLCVAEELLEGVVWSDCGIAELLELLLEGLVAWSLLLVLGVVDDGAELEVDWLLVDGTSEVCAGVDGFCVPVCADDVVLWSGNVLGVVGDWVDVL